MLAMSSDAGIRIGKDELREILGYNGVKRLKSSFMTASMQPPTPLE